MGSMVHFPLILLLSWVGICLLLYGLLRTGLGLAEYPTASPKSATQSLSREGVFYRIKLSFVVTL